MIWQKSRVKWLTHGDANSRYFHSWLNKRRRGNEVLCLAVGERLVEGVHEVREIIKHHYSAHFAKRQVCCPQLLQLNFNQITQEQGAELIDEFSEEEIRHAVWECESSKSPGPDGFNFFFIKEFWEVIKKDIIAYIQEFHKNGKLVRGINCSFIVLIPKKDNLQRVEDYRPISLIGCLYKILAKLLSYRLRLVMDKVISKSQTAFIKGRQIPDGILIANEIVDEANKEVKKGLMFKVDFEKAYDSVSYEYLEFVMRKMSFPVV